MVGLSHHAAPVEVRERIALDETAWRGVAPAKLPTVFLSTCNRVEAYAWVDGRADRAARSLARALARAGRMRLAELQPYLQSRVGHDAFVHLVRVASGLDSLVVGEEQIRAQVREALRLAEAHQKLPATLHGVFERVTESARRIHGATRLGQAPSVASAGVNVARRHLSRDLKGERTVVLGAGVIARAAVESLVMCGAEVCVLNRTPAHAEHLLKKSDGAVQIGALADLPIALGEALLVVGATASRAPVLDRATVERAMADRQRPLVILDLALPRDVEPEVRGVPGVTLIDLDDLEQLCPIDSSTRHAEHERAELLAQQEADRLTEWLRFRAAGPAIAELRNYAESIRTRELRRSATRLRSLTTEQIAAVDALTASIVNKLMHGPTVALRDSALRPRSSARSRSHILGLVRADRRRTA
jgi:glutamyl-tRNA reductase